nr:hypothetical protein [Granulosicoccus sp.]
MIPPIDSAVHQSIGFLVRGDMLQRDLLQTFLLKISDNVSRAQIADSMRIAEIQSASSNDRSLVGGVPDSRVVPGIAAVPQVLEKCVLSQSSTELKFSSTDSPSHEQDQSVFDDDVAGEESSTNTRDTAFRDSASLAILNTLREMLPDLAISGLCSSLFSCLLPGRT